MIKIVKMKATEVGAEKVVDSSELSEHIYEEAKEVLNKAKELKLKAVAFSLFGVIGLSQEEVMKEVSKAAADFPDIDVILCIKK